MKEGRNYLLKIVAPLFTAQASAGLPALACASRLTVSRKRTLRWQEASANLKRSNCQVSNVPPHQRRARRAF